jgi:photosynthetic reaction center cytochrome c subunit
MKMSQWLRGVSFAFAAVGVIVIALSWRPGDDIARATSSSSGMAHPNASTLGHAGKPGQSAQGTAQKSAQTAGDAYMNVQVLKDIPSDQLIPSMRYITAALGVSCDFCHDTKNFMSDDKPEKKTARNMMTMMLTINKDNFNGRREVTCYTCHHGSSKAANIPALAMETSGGSPSATAPGATAAPTGAAAAPPAPTLPNTTVDAVLAKYANALGGEPAIQQITTIDEKGSIQLPGHQGHPGINTQAEFLRKAPDKALGVVYLPNGGQFARGYNGTIGWQQQPGHSAEELSGDDLARLKQLSSFIPGLNLKQGFSRVQLAGSERIGDHDAYRVVAFRNGGGQVRFYFDAQSGLLLRVSERIESFLGALPQDTDFSDYREVSGVKVPFSVTATQVDGQTVFKWDQVQANVPVDDTRFDKPPGKPAQP